jgi:hypothetical protein
MDCLKEQLLLHHKGAEITISTGENSFNTFEQLFRTFIASKCKRQKDTLDSHGFGMSSVRLSVELKIFLNF